MKTFLAVTVFLARLGGIVIMLASPWWKGLEPTWLLACCAFILAGDDA